MGSSLFAFGIALRAAILGVIAFAVIELAISGHYYATALVLLGIGGLILSELAHRVSKADRMLAQFIDGLASEEFEWPISSLGKLSGFSRLREAIERRGKIANEARASRQRQTDYLHTLTDNTTVAFLVVEADGSVILVNRRARQLAGRSIALLSEIDLIEREDAEALLALPAGQRSVLRLKNGQRVLATVARFLADGREQKLISLQNIGSELDAAELKAWQDLVRILAHEMMNSLTPISSLAESIGHLAPQLSTGPNDPDSITAADIAVAVEAISRRSTGLMRFVEQYRKIAAVPQPQLMPLQAIELIRRIDQLVGPMILGQGISYRSSVDPADLVFKGDANLIEQALINLLHNAIEAVRGRQDQSITLSCTRDEQDKVQIAVSDNGAGIDAASRDRIFVPFFTTKAGGSGIGLSLTRQIALAHAGGIEVTQNRPNGAVFTLIFPTD